MILVCKLFLLRIKKEEKSNNKNKIERSWHSKKFCSNTQKVSSCVSAQTALNKKGEKNSRFVYENDMRMTQWPKQEQGLKKEWNSNE